MSTTHSKSILTAETRFTQSRPGRARVRHDSIAGDGVAVSVLVHVRHDSSREGANGPGGTYLSFSTQTPFQSSAGGLARKYSQRSA